VRPFAENLIENVSSHLTMVNLGWIVAHPDIHKANVRRVPILLGKEAADDNTATRKLSSLAAQFLEPKARASLRSRVDPARYLEHELAIMTRLQEDLAGKSYEDNFRYVVARTLHIMSSRRLGDLGDNQVFKRFEFEKVLAQRGR
jgi:hypothetical protein